MGKEDDNTSILDGFLRYTVLLYLILIIVGYLSTSCYYSFFGIIIGSYFTIEDYTNVFFTDNFIIIVVAVLYFPLTLISNTNWYLRFFFGIRVAEVYPIAKEILIKGNKRFLIGFSIIDALSIILFIIFYIISMKSIILEQLLIFIAIITYSLSVSVLIHFSYTGSIKLTKGQVFITTFIILTILIKLSLSIVEGNIVYNLRTNYQKMIFNFNDGKSIKTSDSTIYIGSSSNYIFLFNKNQETVSIYNKSDISSIEKKIKF
jgi:hypothetical protein